MARTAAQEAATGARATGIVFGMRCIPVVTKIAHKTDLTAARMS